MIDWQDFSIAYAPEFVSTCALKVKSRAANACTCCAVATPRTSCSLCNDLSVECLAKGKAGRLYKFGVKTPGTGGPGCVRALNSEQP